MIGKRLLAREFVAAGLVFLLGGAITTAAIELPMGSLRLPGPGALPLAVGFSLIMLSTALALQARSAEPANLRSVEDDQSDPRGILRVILLCILIGGFLFLLPVAGFLVAGAFLLIALHAIGTNGRLSMHSVAAGLLTTAVAYVLFARLLRIPLPHGWIWAF